MKHHPDRIFLALILTVLVIASVSPSSLQKTTAASHSHLAFAQNLSSLVNLHRYRENFWSDVTSLFESVPAPMAPVASVAVNSTTDVADGNTSSIPNLIMNPGNDGVISLREAMTAANNTAGTDTINFNIPGTGVRTITIVNGGLPGQNQPVIINGQSQPGFSSTPLIEINGNATAGDGLTFLGGASTVRGLIINRFGGNGITLQNLGNNLIAGNYIGTNAAGTGASANGQNGILSQGGSDSIIGGLTATDRNVISGNSQNGILLQNSSTVSTRIAGNYIGTNAAGTAAVGNLANGIRIDAPGERIGSGQSGARNIISGNAAAGIAIVNASTDHRIQGNYIGTDATGTLAIPNQFGVFIGDVPTLRGVGNSFVGTDGDGVNDATEGNLVSGNRVDGITLTQAGTSGNLIAGNLIGTNAAGTAALPNLGEGIAVRQGAANNTIGTNGDGISDDLERNIISGNGANGVLVMDGASTGNLIRSNSIFANGGLGIDLGGNGVTPNDLFDLDAGPNNLQNFPVIINARPGSTIIQFSLSSLPLSAFRIEFFSSPTADPAVHGEGQTFLGSTNVTTNIIGSVSGTFTAATTVQVGHVITATATNASNSTSEFSRTRVVIAPTVAKLIEATAVRQQDVVLLRWRTAMEVDNLGFNVYREDRGQKILLTRQLVAGSALFAGRGTVMTAGNGYVWLDERAPASATYWIEDVDLSGRRSLHGPIVPQQVGDKVNGISSPLLSELNIRRADDTEVTQREWPASLLDSDLEAPSSVATPSFIASLPAVKISVNENGWYRIGQPQLVAAGLVPTTDARFLQLYVEGEEVPIKLSTTGAQLTPADSLEFYGEALDLPTTATQIYYLIAGSTFGKRIPLVPDKRSRPGEQLFIEKTATAFATTIEREDNLLYFSSLRNGDAENIFGPLISNTAVSQSLTVQSLAEPSPTDALEVTVQGVSERPHEVRVALNGRDLGQITFNGHEYRSARFPIQSGLLREGSNTVTLSNSGQATDISLLDYLRLTHQKQYRATNNALSFSVAAGRSVRVTGFTIPQLRLFDITEPQSPIERGLTLQTDPAGGYVLSLTAANRARTLMVLPHDDLSAPARIEAKPPSDLGATENAADLLIITHRNFRAAAETLAAWRRTQNLAVEVVDVDTVFDEFSNGLHTPAALKLFLLWTTTHWRQAPRYVLLVGDSTWDPRDYLGHGAIDFIPTRLIDTLNMETASDDWIADFNDDGVPEMSVGRLSVRTAARGDAVVAKLLAYDRAPVDPARAALLVADTDFETMSAEVGALLPPAIPRETVNRSTGPDDAAIRAHILEGLNRGPVFVSFVGHGSVGVWTGAGLLRAEDAANLTNDGKLPLIVSLTCLNSYSHDPLLASLGEALVLEPTAGAIAVWSSSGMTVPDTQQVLARSFYSALFSGPNQRLGDAIRVAKAATSDPDVRRTWLLLGDPSMRLVR